MLALVEKIDFDPSRDRLWLAGDLVNRGPDSLGVLRWVSGQGDAVLTVLGNHDLHLLASYAKVAPKARREELRDILEAPDCAELMEWLRRRPMLVREGNWVLVHAGLLPQWTLEEAESWARDLEAGLRGDQMGPVLAASYTRPEPQWREDLESPEREGCLIHVMTRMRVCDESGRMNLDFKGNPGKKIPLGCRPWFEIPHRRDPEATVVFGHWSQLGLHEAPGAICLDSGCVWGGELTALRLEDLETFQQSRVKSG